MNDKELREEFIREKRIHDGRVENRITSRMGHKLQYPYMYPFGGNDEEEYDDDDDDDRTY